MNQDLQQQYENRPAPYQDFDKGLNLNNWTDEQFKRLMNDILSVEQ